MQGTLAPAEVRASSPAGFGKESQQDDNVETRKKNRKKNTFEERLTSGILRGMIIKPHTVG